MLERPGSEAHASALLNLGELEFASGNIDGARSAGRMALAIYVRRGSVYLILLYSNLAAYAMAAGDLSDAQVHLFAALQLQVRAGRAWLGALMEHHALLAGLSGDLERAARLVGFTDAQYRAAGEVRQHTERLGRERLTALLCAAFPDEERARHMRAGALLRDEEALAEASKIHENTGSLAAVPHP